MSVTTRHAVAEILQARLQQRKVADTFRDLTDKSHLIDLASNDYLGLARSQKLRELTAFYAQQFHLNGATGSRLISGNSAFTEQLEKDIAFFHQAASALLFNSGFDANIGVFASLPQQGDTIISDELVHASIIDGIRLSKARRLIFKHNDLASLEHCLQQATGTTFITVESLYSMDGDLAPLPEIVQLAEQYHAAVIVDEAHATGIFGATGGGLVQELGLEKRVFARIHTFGKALGIHGAVVVGDEVLRHYLINFARSFIFTTAAAPHSLAAVRAAYELLPTLDKERQQLKELTDFFNKNTTQKHRLSNYQTHHVPALNLKNPAASHSPIQSVVVGDSKQAKALAIRLQDAGFYAKAIVYPTVAKGQERVRICLHSFNTLAEVDMILRVLDA